jgi:16S rRNA (adenine1518-N6/adenine1519-N6)-dimethyltransferase
VVGPDQFFPRPQIDSQVVHLTPLETPLVDLRGPGQAQWFGRVVKAAFSQRRKTLANSLAGGLGLERQAVAQALQAAGLDGGRRAETLDPGQLGQVARALAPLAGEGAPG